MLTWAEPPGKQGPNFQLGAVFFVELALGITGEVSANSGFQLTIPDGSAFTMPLDPTQGNTANLQVAPPCPPPSPPPFPPPPSRQITPGEATTLRNHTIKREIKTFVSETEVSDIYLANRQTKPAVTARRSRSSR